MQERNALYKEIVGLGLERELEVVMGNSKPCTTPPDLRPRPTLRFGSKGDHVKYLQQRLNCHRVKYVPLKVDGIFGINTLKAVKAFQTDRGLVVDGIVGPKTWGKLNSFRESPYIPVNNRCDKKKEAPILGAQFTSEFETRFDSEKGCPNILRINVRDLQLAIGNQARSCTECLVEVDNFQVASIKNPLAKFSKTTERSVNLTNFAKKGQIKPIGERHTLKVRIPKECINNHLEAKIFIF